MAENVSLKIIGTLDVNATKPIIDAKISELEKVIKPLNLSINIDKNALKTLDDFTSQIGKLQDKIKSTVQSSKITSTSVFDPQYEQKLKESMSTFDQIVEKYKSLGDIKISNDQMNPLTGDLEKFTLSIEKSTGEVEKLKFELASLKGLVVDDKNINTMFIPTKVSSLNSTNLNSLNQEGVNLTQLSNEQDKLTQSLKKTYDQGLLTEEVFQQFNSSINSSKNVEQLDLIQKALQNTIQVEKNLIAQQDLVAKSQSLLSSGKIVDTAGITSLISDLNNLNVAEENATRQLSLMQTELKGYQASAVTAAEETVSFGDVLKSVYANMTMYFGGFTLIFSTLSSFKNGIDTLNTLNKSLTTISMITHQSQAQVQQLGDQYQQMGQQLSVSTTEIAASATELYRQGLSIDEVNSRLKTITEFSRVAGLSAQDATTYITAATNSMKVSAQQASDVFAMLGHSSGVNAGYIATAFQKVGGTAGALNLDFSKVASWVSTIGERTKESADTIGQSVKSILARVQSLKEKGYDETDGTKVNAVAKSLDAIGVKLIDNQGQFRNFGTVMDELGAKWGSLDNRTKAYIATTVNISAA